MKLKSIFMIVLILFITGCSSSFMANYNKRRCADGDRYDTPECQTMRHKDQLSKIQAMTLPQLESFYEKEILHPDRPIFSSWQPEELSQEAINLVKSRLIDENVKLGTFQGYVQASKISGNSKYVTDHINLVRTTEDQKLLEQFNLSQVADLNNLFDVDFKPKFGKTSEQHEEHMGIFAKHSDYGMREIAGSLKVWKTKTSSGQLSWGHYKLTIKITMHLPSRFVRQSGVLGNKDENIDYTEERTVTAEVAPPNMSASVNVNFGNIVTSRTKRGSRGGVETRIPTGEPTFTVDIVKAEAI